MIGRADLVRLVIIDRTVAIQRRVDGGGPADGLVSVRVDKIVRQHRSILHEVDGQAQHASERAKGSDKLYIGRQSNDRLSLAADPSV